MLLLLTVVFLIFTDLRITDFEYDLSGAKFFQDQEVTIAFTVTAINGKVTNSKSFPAQPPKVNLFFGKIVAFLLIFHIFKFSLGLKFSSMKALFIAVAHVIYSSTNSFSGLLVSFAFHFA